MVSLLCLVLSLLSVSVRVLGSRHRPTRGDDPRNQYAAVFTQMNDRFVSMRSDFEAQKQQIRAEIDNEIQQLLMQIEEEKQLTATLEDTTFHKVAFAAQSLDTDNKNYAQSGGVIQFSKVILNDGGGYSGNFSTFTAPKCGDYWVYVHMEEQRKLAIDLKKNGEVLARCSSGRMPVINCGIVAKLMINDTVVVTHALDGSGTIDYGADSEFSGFLIR